MSITSRIDFSSRFKEYKTKCNNIKNIYNIKDEIKLDIAGFDSGIQTNCWNKQMVAQKDCPRWIKWAHDAEGNFLLDVLHPSLTERNKYLREWSPSTQSRREVLV